MGIRWLIVCILLHIVCESFCDASLDTGAYARVAYHVLWNRSGSEAVKLVKALYDVGNTYVIDAIEPTTSKEISLALKAAKFLHHNIRVRSVDRATPRGITEVLQLIDGMGELLYWATSDVSRTFDYYIPISSTSYPLIRARTLRIALGAALRSADPAPSFLRYSTPSHWKQFSNDYQHLYFDAGIVFSRDTSIRSTLQGPHLRHPIARPWNVARAERDFVLSAALLTTVVDSMLSTRLLATFVHSQDAVEHFFGTLALAAGAQVTTLIKSTSLRCPDVRGLDDSPSFMQSLSYNRPTFRASHAYNETVPCMFLAWDASEAEREEAVSMLVGKDVNTYEERAVELMKDHISRAILAAGSGRDSKVRTSVRMKLPL